MEKVLVRARVDAGESLHDYYSKTEFHLLDLKQGKITYNLMPPLLSPITTGGIVSLGSSVYVIGGFPFPGESLCPNRPPLGPGVHEYLGGSRFDFSTKINDNNNNNNNNWKCMPTNCKVSELVVPLLGKIYGFGWMENCIEVFDPTLNQWELLDPIPSPFDESGINSLVVLPDPKNRRIIVSLWNMELDTMPLAFYYPPVAVGDDDTDTGRSRWEFISNNITLNQHVAALVDDVLYIFSEHESVILLAYDLNMSQWLDVSWTTTLPDGAVKKFFMWDTLFVLHHNVLCFGSWSLRDDGTGMEMTLLKFKVERTSSSTVHATYLDGQAYDIPSAFLIHDLVPLDQEAEALLSAD